MSVIPLPDVINMLTFNQHTKENSDISLIDILNEYASCETIHYQMPVHFLLVANKIWHDSFKCVQYMFIRLYSEKALHDVIGKLAYLKCKGLYVFGRDLVVINFV